MTPEAQELAKRLARKRLPGVSTRDHLRLLETVFRVGDLDVGQHLVYVQARQNERMIALLESIAAATSRMARVLEEQTNDQ